MTIQVAHGQILVDMLDELRALRLDLEHLRRTSLPPPFDDGLLCHLLFTCIFHTCVYAFVACFRKYTS